jgi:hypothetical protein
MQDNWDTRFIIMWSGYDKELWIWQMDYEGKGNLILVDETPVDNMLLETSLR